MKLNKAIRERVLQIALKEGWDDSTVRITHARKDRRVTVSVVFYEDLPTDQVEQTIRHGVDALRDLQSPDVRNMWPEVVIRAKKQPRMVVTGVEHTRTDVVYSPFFRRPSETEGVRETSVVDRPGATASTRRS